MTGRFVKVKCECKNLFFQKKGSSKKELSDPFGLRAAKSVYGNNAAALNGASFHGGLL